VLRLPDAVWERKSTGCPCEAVWATRQSAREHSIHRTAAQDALGHVLVSIAKTLSPHHAPPRYRRARQATGVNAIACHKHALQLSKAWSAFDGSSDAVRARDLLVREGHELRATCLLATHCSSRRRRFPSSSALIGSAPRTIARRQIALNADPGICRPRFLDGRRGGVLRISTEGARFRSKHARISTRTSSKGRTSPHVLELAGRRRRRSRRRRRVPRFSPPRIPRTSRDAAGDSRDTLRHAATSKGAERARDEMETDWKELGARKWARRSNPPAAKSAHDRAAPPCNAG